MVKTPMESVSLVIIRGVEFADIPALARLAKTTYSATFGHSMKPEQLAAALEHSRSEEYFSAHWETDTILVALENTALVGYIQLSDVRLNVRGATPTNKDQAVHGLYVHPSHQGRGIGKALMKAAFDHPRFKNADSIYIDVWEANRRAVDFYLKCGFKLVGTCDVFVGETCIGEDLVFVRRSDSTS